MRERERERERGARKSNSQAESSAKNLAGPCTGDTCYWSFHFKIKRVPHTHTQIFGPGKGKREREREREREVNFFHRKMWMFISRNPFALQFKLHLKRTKFGTSSTLNWLMAIGISKKIHPPKMFAFCRASVTGVQLIWLCVCVITRQLLSI